MANTTMNLTPSGSMECDFAFLESIPAYEFSTTEVNELEQLFAESSTVGEYKIVGEEKEKAPQALASEHNYSIVEESPSNLELSLYNEDSSLSDDISWSEQDGCQSQTEDVWVKEFLNPILRKKADYSPGPEEDSSCSVSNASPDSQSSSLSEDVDVQSPDGINPPTSKRSRKRKASGGSSVAADTNSVGIISKNAIAARENRLKKKKYVEDLEEKNRELEEENNLIHEREKDQQDRIQELEQRNAYLENVLHNDSALSSLLGNLPGSEVRLTIAGQGGRKKRRGGGGGGSHEVIPSMSKGVCLHVDGQTASLELCSHCAIMAKGGST